MPYDIEKEGSLPFINNYFDVVTMLAVIEHIKPDKLMPIFKEVKRVLKKDGIFIITTPSGWTDKILRFLSRIYFVSRQEIKEHKNAYNHKKIFAILEKAGYKKEDTEGGYFEVGMNIWIKAKCIKY